MEKYGIVFHKIKCGQHKMRLYVTRVGRMISDPSLPRTGLVSALKVPCAGKPLSPRQNGKLGHPC